MKAAALIGLCLSSLVAKADWQPFAPRAEIAPVCETKANAGRHGSNALHVSSGGKERRPDIPLEAR